MVQVKIIIIYHFFNYYMQQQQSQIQTYDQSISSNISKRILPVLKNQKQQLIKLLYQYNDVFLYYQNQRLIFEKALQKLKVNKDMKERLINNINFISKRIGSKNQKSQSYQEVQKNIEKLDNILILYQNIDDKIQFQHISNFKDLNSIYFEIVTTNYMSDFFAKHRYFLSKFKQDLNFLTDSSIFNSLASQFSKINQNINQHKISFLTEIDNMIQDLEDYYVIKSRLFINEAQYQTQN